MSSFPNFDPTIREKINEIRKWADSNEMRTLKNQNKVLFLIEAEKKYANFKEEYPTIFDLILRDNEDLSILNQMLNTIEKINANKMDKFEGEKLIGERLANEYLYPVVNNKKN